MTNKFFYLENKNALCSHSAVEYAYFWSRMKSATLCGLFTLVTSNNDIFNPNCCPFVSLAYLPNPMIVFSSYGCKYLENPDIFNSPKMVGLLWFDKSITKNGSICLKVTKYNLLSTYLAEKILYPTAMFLKVPITVKFLFKQNTLFDGCPVIPVSVVAILKTPLNSSIENWLLTVP